MSNDGKQDERIMKITTEAMEKPPEERETYVRSACAGDDGLYREVAETITWEERMGRFLLHPMVVVNDPAAALVTGQIVDGRFEIVRQIGEGGMGVVYEAVDAKRRLRVALKFGKLGCQRLLAPELEGALRVRHPNICLVNQIHTANIKSQQVDFLAMEYVEGQTLTQYLLDHGKLPQQRALEVARQLCAGISEAHRSGIVHRDLKPGNIMLCKTDGDRFRVVIMDFGLANAFGVDGAEGGTPGYMAPELLKHERASFASDVYALGVILHEIVTSRMPVEDKAAEPGKPHHFVAPSTLTKGLDPRWDRVILSCLNPSPALRPSDARDVIAGLEKEPFRKAPLVLAGLLMAIAFAIPVVRQSVVDWIWPPPSVRLAILPPTGDKLSADKVEGVLQDVADRIRHISSRRRTVSVIPPSEDIQTPEQARDVLHATHALQTTVNSEGDHLVAKGSVIDLATRTKLREFSGRYTNSTIGTLPTALAGSASVALRLHGPATPDVLSSAATSAYDRGLHLLRKDQPSFNDAIAAFEEAARLDPRSPLPPAGLVEANIMKYEQTNQERFVDDARRALRTAESLNPDSPRVRLAAGVLKETTGQYEQALEDYRRVEELEPRNEEVFRRMAAVYDKQQMPSEAIRAYQKAIELDSKYYAGYHGLGVFYYYHGNYQLAAEQFQQSIDRAPGRYDEYTNLGAAYDELGQDAKAEAAFKMSLTIHETPRALNSMGAMLAYQKRDEEAVSYYTKAISLDRSEYLYLINLADSNRRLRRASEAKAAYREAMDMALAALRNDPRNGYHRGFVAYIAARLEDCGRARDEIAQALQLSPAETKVTRSAVLTYEVCGERDRAIPLLEDAPPELLRELDRQPDLADFRQDPRFRRLVNQIPKGGK